MRISFSPTRPLPGSEGALVLEKSHGDRLRINGDLFNFNPLLDGGTIPEGAVPSDFIVGPVDRIDGEVHITLRLPVSGDCTDPWMCFPETIHVTEDGPIDVPFATYSETAEEKVAGGTKIITTTRRWHQPDEVQEQFIPDPVAEEEPADVDA